MADRHCARYPQTRAWKFALCAYPATTTRRSSELPLTARINCQDQMSGLLALSTNADTTVSGLVAFLSRASRGSTYKSDVLPPPRAPRRDPRPRYLSSASCLSSRRTCRTEQQQRSARRSWVSEQAPDLWVSCAMASSSNLLRPSSGCSYAHAVALKLIAALSMPRGRAADQWRSGFLGGNLAVRQESKL